MNVQINYSMAGMKELLEKTGPEGLGRALKETLRLATMHLAEGVAEQASGQALGTRSGALVKAWRSKGVRITKSGPTSMVARKGAVRTKYGTAHETGETISAKAGKKLIVPLDAAQTATGKGRRKTGALMRDLVIRRSKAGQLLLVKLPQRRKFGPPRQNSRKTGVIPPIPPGSIPFFIMLDKIKLKKTSYVTKGVEAREGGVDAIGEQVFAEHLRMAS